jgi:enoyl-CoA hydratase/carnithine racemase
LKNIFKGVQRISMDYSKILYEKQEHVVIITLNRPEVHNCLSRKTALELHDARQTFRDDDDAFVAIMTGAGEKAFSAGWDLKEAAQLTSMGDYDRQRVNLYNMERMPNDYDSWAIQHSPHDYFFRSLHCK